MTEIIFRGKTEKGEWVYGDLLHPDNCGAGYSIEDFTKDKNNCFDVIPETVGQYTGLTDKSGKKIFEGDIIIELDGGMDGIPRKVVWEEEYMQYKCPLVRRHWAYAHNECGLWMVQSENIEVIGNIHDNPELIGGGRMRERLIQLISNADEECKHSKDCKSCSGYGKGSQCINYHIADYLIDNGVVLPPCKVGDVVYRIYTRAWIGEDVVREVVVSENGVFYIDDKGRMTSCNKFGKTVFLTREDAERAVKGGEEK